MRIRIRRRDGPPSALGTKGTVVLLGLSPETGAIVWHDDDPKDLGLIQGRVQEGYDTWQVNCDVGFTFCENGRDLRPGAEPMGNVEEG
jgi:hypothetical protein